jgi:SAM-dependent methyltransferase
LTAAIACRDPDGMDAVTEANRVAWEAASSKHVREYDDLLAQAASGSSLNAIERGYLREILAGAPEVVHLQSGHGLEDTALVQAGAKSVVGIDYSCTAAGASQRRADELALACRYIVGAVPGVPLADGTADLVYTGKGALIWMPDLDAWACETARLLRPGGHLSVYEGTRRPLCGPGTRTPRASEPTAATSRAATSTTPFLPAEPPSGSTPWARSSLPSSPRAWNCSPSPSTRSPSGDPTASAPQPGTGACPTPTACLPAAQRVLAARSARPAGLHPGSSGACGA